MPSLLKTSLRAVGIHISTPRICLMASIADRLDIVALFDTHIGKPVIIFHDYPFSHVSCRQSAQVRRGERFRRDAAENLIFQAGCVSVSALYLYKVISSTSRQKSIVHVRICVCGTTLVSCCLRSRQSNAYMLFAFLSSAYAVPHALHAYIFEQSCNDRNPRLSTDTKSVEAVRISPQPLRPWVTFYSDKVRQTTVLHCTHCPRLITPRSEFVALFSRFGTVCHCVILATLDNASRRRGFVVMSSNEEARLAMSALSRTQIKYVFRFNIREVIATVPLEVIPSIFPGQWFNAPKV